VRVQFFERWFAASPDGGSGLLELAYAAAAVAVLVAVVARRPLAAATRKLLARAARATRRT
jgi:hypothetical protein